MKHLLAQINWKDKNSVIFVSLVALSLLLTLLTILFHVVSILSPDETPIVPVNSITKKRNTSSTTSGTKESQPSQSSQSKKAEPIEESGTKNVIVEGKSTNSDEYEGESIATYKVKKKIEENNLVTAITNVAISKLDSESMAAINQTGQGIVDIDIQLENKSKEDITIFPTDVKLTILGVEYPVFAHPVLVNGTMSPGAKLEGSLSVALPELKASKDIKEISFPWKSATKSGEKLYEVTIVLN